MPKKKGPIQPFEARLCRLPIFDRETNEITGFTKDPKFVKVMLPHPHGHFNYSIEHKTWTRHRPDSEVTNRTGTNVLRTEKRVSKFKDNFELRKKLGHAKIEYQGELVSLTHLVVKLRNSVFTP